MIRFLSHQFHLLVFFLLASTQLHAQVTPSKLDVPKVEKPLTLQVEIKLEKQKFKIGEPIILTYLLKNMSSEETVLLSSMPFVYLPSLLRIKAPNGELMKSEKARGQFSNSEQMLFPLLPSGTYSFSFDLRGCIESHLILLSMIAIMAM